MEKMKNNIIDLFLDKYSYRFSKGYPDLNNPSDKLLLEHILLENGINTDISNFGYRVGGVNTPSESLQSRNWYFGSKIGYLGTGFYFFGDEKHALEHSKSLLTKNTIKNDVHKINLDQYNLFKPSDPKLFYDYIKEITYSLGNLVDKELTEPEIIEGLEEIIYVIKNELSIDLSEDEIKNIIYQFIDDVKNKKEGTLLTNRLLSSQYDGIDNRGSELDNFGVGSILFELKPNTYELLK
jgi:hypothetical protein